MSTQTEFGGTAVTAKHTAGTPLPVTIIVLHVSVKNEPISSLQSFSSIYHRRKHFKAKRDC